MPNDFNRGTIMFKVVSIETSSLYWYKHSVTAINATRKAKGISKIARIKTFIPKTGIRRTLNIVPTISAKIL